jgi:hypothetical protein
MDRSVTALIAAVLVTALLGTAMYLMGRDALVTADVVAASTQVAVDNQNVLNDFKAREKQYTSQLTTAARRLSAANQQIDLANRQIEQYQAVFNQLEQQGLIAIAKDGTITILQQPKP